MADLTSNNVLKNNRTSRAAVIRRILDAWNRATDSDKEAGAVWYREANAHCVALTAYGWSMEQAAAVLAHLSPRTTWARNVAGAYALATKEEPKGCMSANVTRARVAIDAPDPLLTINGPKTKSFALNILGDAEAVTVDVWAARVAFGDRDDIDKTLSRAGVYDAVADCYRAAARKMGVAPSTMQAVTWIVARNGRSE